MTRHLTAGLLVAVLCLLAGCGEEAPTDWQSSGVSTAHVKAAKGPIITLGDIDPDTPTRRLQIMRPLADHVADELGWDRSRVRVRIGRSVDEMISMFYLDEVDLYLDSGYPALLVSRETGADIVLESLVNGAKLYQTVIVANFGGPVETIDDLNGNVIVLQERYSTSGFLAPAALLVGHGYELQYLQSETSIPDEDKVGFVFSGDEENTLAMLREGTVHVGAISSMDYDSLPEEIQSLLIVLTRSKPIPRKLATLRAGFDDALKTELLNILLSISDEDRDRFVAQNSWNWEFSALDEASGTGISALQAMIDETRDIVPE